MPKNPVSSESSGMSPTLKALGVAALAVACGSALMLALDHFDLARAPGCGPRSGCDQAARSAWGSVPGLGYPTSLVGTAYFAALLVGWMFTSRRASPMFRAIAWLGGAMSIMFIIAMLAGGYLCKYCVAAHAGNLVFVGVMEITCRRGDRAAAARATPMLMAFATFALASIALAVTHVQTESRREARDEADRLATLDRLMGATTRAAAEPLTAIATTSQPDLPSQPEGPPFTGRWLLGPENAPIRIVMFTDYQCPDCKIMEAAAMRLVEARKDVSLSVKHFPMSSMCNRHVGGANPHPNACWAARAAETAGQLYGNDGFWKMHRWLFSRGGSFTDADFPPALAQLGFDPQKFIAHMQTQPTLAPVLADIEEGADLGLFITPLIFINGVELRGFVGKPDALGDAVRTLGATNPPPASPTRDQPPRAAHKYVDDWALGQREAIPVVANPHAIGPDAARVQIVVWGDLQDQYTADLDRRIREQIAAGRDIRYEYRHYPVDQACNSFVQRTIYPFGCMAARAADAAGLLGGNDAFWKMHQWLLANQKPLNTDMLKQAASASGVDGDALLAKMNEPVLQTALRQGAQQAQPFILKGFVPSLHVNGRWVPRWKLEGTDIVKAIIEQAERE